MFCFITMYTYDKLIFMFICQDNYIKSHDDTAHDEQYNRANDDADDEDNDVYADLQGLQKEMEELRLLVK